MAKTQVEVITSVERRRRWSSAEKERLVAASLERGLPCQHWRMKPVCIRPNCTDGGANCVPRKKHRRHLMNGSEALYLEARPIIKT